MHVPYMLNTLRAYQEYKLEHFIPMRCQSMGPVYFKFRNNESDL